MRRSILITVAILLFIGAVIALFKIRTTPAAQYQGRSASYWLDCVFQTTYPPKSGPSQREAFAAFRAMGTAALPFLLAELERPETTSAKLHMWLYRALPKTVSKHLPKPNYNLRQSAANLMLMNNNHRPAVPQLVRIVKNSGPKPRELALDLLTTTVHESEAVYLPVFETCLKDTNARCRYSAVTIIGQIGPSAAQTEPKITPLLSDSDDLVRMHAAYALWQITQKTNASVPVLKALLAQNDANFNSFTKPIHRAGDLYYSYKTSVASMLLSMEPACPEVQAYFRNKLRSADARERNEACDQLTSMGHIAVFALDDLTKLKDDSDQYVREAATRAVASIKYPRN